MLYTTTLIIVGMIIAEGKEAGVVVTEVVEVPTEVVTTMVV